MQGQFLRLVGENSLVKEMVPEKIIRYCATIDIADDRTNRDTVKLTESGLRMNCNVTHLKLHRLMIGTCITLGSLMHLDFPANHFTHVIVDESGQCMETEIMIPLSFVDPQHGQIILAGDPMQLGPIVLSHFAQIRGLDQSYLVRLLDRTVYRPDTEVSVVQRFIEHFRIPIHILSRRDSNTVTIPVWLLDWFTIIDRYRAS